MEKNVAKTKVYNVIIMDRSGSMWDIQRPAIQGFNEVLGGVKAAKKKYPDTQEQFITLVLFDSSSIDNIYWNSDPDAAEILTAETYVPGACTPLYDAMGRTLTRLEKELRGDDKHSVAVTVITDGLENSSEEYTLASIRGLVEHLKTKGWSFAYMGTDHDVQGVSVSLSITNVIQFQKTEEETIRTFKKERRAREKWAEEENAFNLACPEATYEERIAFSVGRAERYYDEGPVLNPAYADRVTPEKVKTLAPDEVFVFGSNDKGAHKGGAAGLAVKKFGAQRGVAEGPQGQSYAVPTVGPNIGPHEIHFAFERFVEYAKAHPEKTFLVTALGCGHGGYDAAFITNYLEGGVKVPNVHYPLVFWQEFEKRGLV
ncbi:MAG: hypothetical protein IJ584_10765 [Bacteroidales bacterium]|nr:hypothetical protein [Bacteroidales bacterium]